MPTPDFVSDLREHIGHAPLWLPGAAGIIMLPPPADAPLWEVPRVLLVRRADTGAWTPPTGICDPGEDPHATIIREVREEIGLDITVDALLGVGAAGPVTYPNGDVCHFMETTMRCTPVLADAAPVPDGTEVLEARWFPISQLPTSVAPRFRLVIADAAAQLKHPQTFRPRMGYRKRSAGPASES